MSRALARESLAVLLPDSVAPDRVARALGLDPDAISVSPAVGRDAGSVWVLSPRPIRVGRLGIVPADTDAAPDTLRLLDREAFGTGLHPTTALCLEALDDAVRVAHPNSVLDVGTGSGILALAALMLGVPRALGIRRRRRGAGGRGGERAHQRARRQTSVDAGWAGDGDGNMAVGTGATCSPAR